MKITVNKNGFFFFQLVMVSLVIGMFSTFVLPSKFYNDANLIVNDPYNEIGLFGGYPFTMLFYKVTLLKHLPYILVCLIQLPILFYLVYQIGVPQKFNIPTLTNSLVYISILLIGLFICIPSKEFINFSYMALILYFFRKKRYSLRKTVIISFILFAIISVFLRPYYIFLPILSLIMYMVTFIKSRIKIVNVLLISLLTAVFMSLSYGLVKGRYISQDTRERHNMDRLGSTEAQSMLLSPLPTDTWYGETIGIFYGYISVNFPISVYKQFLKPQVVAFVIWQILLFIILYKRFKICLANRKELKYELWVFLFIFSYFVVQGLFEPDLGTAIRHKIGVFPFLYFALYYDRFVKREKLH